MLLNRYDFKLSVSLKSGEAPAKGAQGLAVGTVWLREGPGRELGVSEP